MTKSMLASQLQNTLLVLKQRQGASLAQIRKRLKISNSLDVRNKRLSHTLNSLVQQGMVKKQPKGLYKLAASNTPAEEVQKEMVPHRRRRALPRGSCKRHRAYHKLRSRRGLRHRRRRRRHSRRRRRHSRRRRRTVPTVTSHRRHRKRRR